MKVTAYIQYTESEETKAHIAIYDENQLLIEDTDFDENGLQIHKTSYQYNSEQGITKMVQFDEQNELIQDIETVYNGKDKQLNTIHFPDGSISFERYIKENNTLNIITEDEDGEFEGSILHILDENGLSKEIVRTNFMNKVDTRLLYEYDDRKQITKITEQDAKGHFLRANAYGYDESGNTITEDNLNKKGEIIARVLHKYENGNLISTQTANDSAYFIYENDLLIKEEKLNPDGSSDIITFEYTDGLISFEKHYSIPQGEEIIENFLIFTKRYEYTDN